jgi:3-deoxy-D-manno-octulosonic-acid transferase
VRPLARRAIRSARAVAAQSRPDAERLLALGALPERLTIAGNVKFDMGVPGGLGAAADLLRDYWGKARPVWIAASTHEGEEAAMIQAHAQVLHRYPDALLLLAPRHPERFRPVVQLCRQYGFRTRVRSEDTVALTETEVFVIDTLGELLTFYAACDVAFVAGSFDPIGGHNVLEPAALGRPVIVGPHTFNFAEITETMLEADAAVRVDGAAALGEAVVRLFNQPGLRDAMGRAGLDVVARERGAVDRVMRIVASVVDDDPWFRDDGPAPSPARKAA